MNPETYRSLIDEYSEEKEKNAYANVNKDINLPCISAIYKQINGVDAWFQGIGVIAAAFILYRYFMYLYNRIDDTLSFRENNMQGYFDDSLWGGM